MDRTTYWGYSLSWYNLAGERRNGEIKRKERGERKGQEEKEREREKKDKREKKHFTSFKVHSADNQALLWGHHPGTGSESGSPFSSISPINQPSFHPRIPKHSRRHIDLYSGVYTVGKHNGDTSTFLMMVLPYTQFSLLGYEYIIKM